MFNSTLQFNSDLSAIVTRKDGTIEDSRNLGTSIIKANDAWKTIKESKSFWNRLYLETKSKLPYIMSAGALAYAYLNHDLSALHYALVTTAGINILSNDMTAGASTHISAFSY